MCFGLLFNRFWFPQPTRSERKEAVVGARPPNMEVGDEDIWAGHIDPVGRPGGAEKPRGLDLAGLRHRAPPSPILCLSNTTQRPPPSVVLDSNLSHRRRSCVVLDLLPASGASPCLLAPKSSRPAGAGGGPRSTERGPSPGRPTRQSNRASKLNAATRWKKAKDEAETRRNTPERSGNGDPKSRRWKK